MFYIMKRRYSFKPPLRSYVDTIRQGYLHCNLDTEYLKRRLTPYLRYGLDHLDSELPIYKIPGLIRSAPDYIIFTKGNVPLFFEAKGFKDIVKLKGDIKKFTTKSTINSLKKKYE